jgi:tetratricopeptide (TPR) repeat protein
MVSSSSGGSLIGKIGSYLQIVTKDPSSTAFVPLAEAYRQIGLLDDALEVARLGTNMLPHFSPGFSTMGRILGQIGRIDEAMNAYSKALDIDPQSQAALVGLARLYLVRGERDQARKILNQAKSFHPYDEKIADMLIALDLPRPWSEIKKTPPAQELSPQQEGPPFESGEPIVTATLAEVYVKQGLLDQAIKVYEEVLRLNPDNVAARERVLQLNERLGPGVADIKAVPQTTMNMATKSGQDVAAGIGSRESLVESAETESVTRDYSPLAVMQRWLSVIRQGRANVQ